MLRRLLIIGVGVGTLAAMAVAPAGASLLGATSATTLATASATSATTQSNNWSGYAKSILASGAPFQSVSATWVVPTATQHTPNQAESSATWVGIGGGCLDHACAVGDGTLVQAGTEQDVDASGQASYYAWWEIVPVPSVAFPALAVHPGDTVSVSLTQSLPEVWNIVVKDLSSGQSASASQSVPYLSDYSTAEFIEETPLEISSSGAGITAMPNLSTVGFSAARINGAGAGLTPADEIQLVDANGHILATPSAPGSGAASFNDCTYATTCPAP